jgi:hypothetical protein
MRRTATKRLSASGSPASQGRLFASRGAERIATTMAAATMAAWT